MVHICILLAPLSLPAIEHTTTVEPHEDFLEITIAAVGADLAHLFDNLGSGMSARLFGDKFIRQFQPSYDVRWDPYDGRYRVVSRDGTKFRFDDEAALWQFLFNLPEYRIPWSALPQAEIIVETQVTYTPIVFVSALAVLSLLRLDGTESSEWARFTTVRAGVSP
jgi:hypothetical protein